MSSWWMLNKHNVRRGSVSSRRALQMQQLENRCLLCAGFATYSFELVALHDSDTLLVEYQKAALVEAQPIMMGHRDEVDSGRDVEEELRGEGEGSDEPLEFELSNLDAIGLDKTPDATIEADVEDSLSGSNVDSYFARLEANEDNLPDSGVSNLRNARGRTTPQSLDKWVVETDGDQQQVSPQNGEGEGEAEGEGEGRLESDSRSPDAAQAEIPDVGVRLTVLVTEVLHSQIEKQDTAWPDGQMSKSSADGTLVARKMNETSLLDQGNEDLLWPVGKADNPAMNTADPFEEVKSAQTASSSLYAHDQIVSVVEQVADSQAANITEYPTNETTYDDLMTQLITATRSGVSDSDRYRAPAEARGALRVDNLDADDLDSATRAQVFASYAAPARQRDGEILRRYCHTSYRHSNRYCKGFLTDVETNENGMIGWFTRPEIVLWAVSVALMVLAAEAALQRSRYGWWSVLVPTRDEEPQVLGLFPELFGRTPGNRP